MTALEGRRVGSYKIIDRIGKGGMAWVYRATHKSFGAVAFKILPPYATVEAADRQRFLREARTIKLLDDLDHPSIIKLYEAGSVPSPFSKHDDLLFIAMELLVGGTLHQRIDEGTVAQRFILPMMIDLGEALGMAHAKGIIHRDIKPANILFRENNIPVLCDFGIARLGDATAMTATGMGIGTIDYMAPELLDHRRALANPVTDVYALALTLYEALAGANPFREAGNDMRVVMREIVNHTPPSIAAIAPNLPAGVIALIDRCLSKDPTDRPADGHAFAEALRAAGVVARSAGGRSGLLVAGAAPTPPPAAQTVAYVAAPMGERSAAALTAVSPPASSGTPPAAPAASRSRRTRPLAIFAAGFVALALLGGGWMVVAPDPADRASAMPPTITPLPKETVATAFTGSAAATPTARAAPSQAPIATATATAMVTATTTIMAPPAPAATLRPSQPTARLQPTATVRTSQPTKPAPTQPQPAPPTAPAPQPEPPTIPPQLPTEAPAASPITPEPPTAIPEPPTDTPEPPTDTPEPPTEAPRPTNTPRPPTNTPEPPTNTPKPTPCDDRGCEP